MLQLVPALVSLLMTFASAIPALAEGTRHVGVIDAGSSGSRIHLYRLSATGDGHKVEDVFDHGARGALSAHADAPERAGDLGVRPLLDALGEKLAERGLGKDALTVHVLATGGMRLVEPRTADAIYASVARTVAESGYRLGAVATISGEMEGLYAWLDVNYLMGALSPGRTPVGVIEIGGASVQVAYAVASNAAGQGAVTASLNGRTYTVRSLSFLGLGAEEARKGMMASQAAPDNSCYPAGLSSENPDLKDVRGAFDIARCESAFLSVISGQKAAASIHRDEISRVTFVGLGRPLTGVLADWRLAEGAAGKLRTTAEQKCALPWNEIAREVGASAYAQYLCANSTYLATLLFHPSALGLAPDQITAIDRIGRSRPSWTRGAALMLGQAP